jgi:hypothetical protein
MQRATTEPARQDFFPQIFGGDPSVQLIVFQHKILLTVESALPIMVRIS